MSAPDHQISEKALLEQMDECPEQREVWVHRKTGRMYEVVGRCIIEAAPEPAVLYQATGAALFKVIWCRPLKEWSEKFERL